MPAGLYLDRHRCRRHRDRSEPITLRRKLRRIESLMPSPKVKSMQVFRQAAIAGLAAALSACAETAGVPTEQPGKTIAAAPPTQHPPETTSIALSDAAVEQQRPATFVLGNSQFIAKPGEKPAVAEGGEKGIQLSFVDTDIRSVLNSILGDALGLSYTIDPAIKGSVTVQSARPLQRAELLRALEAALSLQEIAMVEHDGAYDVVPMKDAQRRISAIRLPDSAGTPGFGVQILSLRYTSAEEMTKLLEPFAPAGAIVRTDGARNLLILAGTGQELASLLDIAQTFDVDWLAGMSYAFFPVEYADAKAVTEELKQIFDDQKGPMSGVVRLIPLQRLNTVLVASPQPEYLQKVGDWIKRLDLGNSSGGRRIYVYDVQNDKASDLASTLNQMFGIGDSGGAPSGQSTPSNSSFNSGLNSLSGGSGTGFGGFGSTQGGGQMLGNSGGQSFGQAQYQQQPQAAATSRAYATASSGQGANLETAGLRIVPDESTNSLLVLATPSEFGIINAAIKRLDVPPRQVLIEASLAEVTLNNDIKFGVEWAFKSGGNSVGFSPNGDGSVAQQFPGFSYLYTGTRGISATLNALETITKVKVLSAPKLLVLNNHEADIEVGDQVPILTQQAVSTSQTGAPIVNSVAQRDTGVILHVTPRVNQSGMVILDIDQEVSSVVPTTTSNIDSPTIQQRKVTSTVAVHDGETIALGGLITDTKTNGKNGIPLIQRIPLIGSLFGTTDVSDDRTELIVLIKPRVIRDPDELHKVMDDLHEQFRSVERQTAQGSAHGNDGKGQ